MSVKDKFVMSIGIKASVLEGFSQISVKVILFLLMKVDICTYFVTNGDHDQETYKLPTSTSK